MKKLALLSLALIAFFNICNGQPIPADSLYLGQTPPGSTPKVFAPGIVSGASTKENVITFSPDGKQVFFDRGTYPSRYIMQITYENNSWSAPSMASFSIGKYPGEPSFSPNGEKVFCYLNNDIYFSQKLDNGWSSLASIGNPINTGGYEFHPCLVNDSSLYFVSGNNGEIFRSQYQSGIYQKPVRLPAIINTGVSYADAYVAPNESYLIFHSKKSGGFGDNDLYISYKKENGSWTNPKNLGNKINTPSADWDGDITPDGKYMTFSRIGDIYWVSASFIDSLKHTNFVPYSKNQIKNQSDTVGHSFSFTIADTIFFDDDGNNTLTYSATLSNGNPLPKGLSFDPDIKTFSGTLDSIATFTIKVTATDTAMTSASTTFTLKVLGNPTNSVQHPFNENIQVFPNPTNDRLTVSFGSLEFKSAVVELRDLSGRLISPNTCFEASTATIDLTGNPKGVYILNLTVDGYKLSKKILFK